MVALCLVVGSLTQMRKHNSQTLSDYATQHPELNETAVSAGSSNSQETDNNNSSASDSTENFQNENENTSATILTGAILNADTMKTQRITYIDDFYYEPLSDNLRRYITGVSYPITESENISTPDNSGEKTADSKDYGTAPTDLQENPSVNRLSISYDNLRYVHILHYDFEGNLAEGELICNESIAQDLVEIFYELYRNEYQLERVLLIDEYDGDDTASMEDNNTSCFNYRVVDGAASLSKHALGVAIDINPFYNPYITYEKDGSEKISPAASIDYADRSANFPYKIDKNDLCYKLFTEHGFTWGGNWNSCKDYQHFQKIVAK